MNGFRRGLLVGTAVVSLTLTMAACGKAGGKKSDDSASSDSGSGKGQSIGLLLPDTVTARYERFDRPLIEAKVKELCPSCDVQYDNAAGDPSKQAQQVNAMITKGVKVLILDAQDSVGIKS